jgi:casein kinase 1 alpha
LGCSPKDDLESLGFIIAYLLRRGILFTKEGKTKEEKGKLMEDAKIKMIPEKFFKDLPCEVI